MRRATNLNDPTPTQVTWPPGVFTMAATHLASRTCSSRFPAAMVSSQGTGGADLWGHWLHCWWWGDVLEWSSPHRRGSVKHEMSCYYIECPLPPASEARRARSEYWGWRGRRPVGKKLWGNDEAPSLRSLTSQRDDDDPAITRHRYLFSSFTKLSYKTMLMDALIKLPCIRP